MALWPMHGWGAGFAVSTKENAKLGDTPFELRDLSKDVVDACLHRVDKGGRQQRQFALLGGSRHVEFRRRRS